MPKKIKRSPLEKLLKHWERASAEDRRQFLATTLGEGATPGFPEASTPVDAPDLPILIANGRYLLPDTVRRIERIMIARRITPETIAQEIGFAGEGHALTRALVRQASLRLAIIAALRAWILDSSATPQR
ncbi:hypothetical protein [Rhizobium sp. FY34]|uniref:hypothetical protein n=1 Tax=Rhizobium sp. FY34 TaxID=2562309 RepID=UPI0010BF7835|nr:hypothetical protein [Rhizobium sp. FY34]